MSTYRTPPNQRLIATNLPASIETAATEAVDHADQETPRPASSTNTTRAMNQERTLKALRRLRTVEANQINDVAAQAEVLRAAPAGVNRDEVAVLLETVRTRFAKLQELNERLLDHSELDEDAFEAEVAKFEESSAKATRCMAVLDLILKGNDRQPAPAETLPPADPPVATASAPHLDVAPEPFCSDRLKYRQFIAQFKNWVSKRPSATNTDRLVALVKHLKGDAKVLVSALEVNDHNYEVALSLLESNYGRLHIERHTIMASLLSLPAVRDEADGVALRRLLNSVQADMKTLEAIGSPLESYAMALESSLKAALPSSLLFSFSENQRLTRLAQGATVPEGPPVPAKVAAQEISDLIEFISRYVLHREETSLSNKAAPRRPRPAEGRLIGKHGHHASSSNGLRSTVAGATHQRTQKIRPCLFCNVPTHSTSRCPADIPHSQRLDTLKKLNRCSRCFRQRHERPSECPGPSTYQTISPQVLAFTATAFIIDGGARYPIRIFLDTGSTLTFVTSATIAALPSVKPLHKAELNVQAFGSRHRILSSRYRLRIQGTRVDDHVDVFAYEYDFGVNPSIECSSETQSAIKLFAETHELADRALLGKLPADPPALLVGIDQFYKIALLGREKSVMQGLTAKQTILGWVVGGSSSTPQTASVVHDVLIVDSCCPATLTAAAEDAERLWTLDSIGIHDAPKETVSSEEKAATLQFTEGLQYDGNRYTVSVPKNSKITQLVNNQPNAFQRLEKRLASLRRRPDTYRRYHQEIMTFIDEGHAEEVDFTPHQTEIADGSYYMPHHPVVTQSGDTEKWRIVFDCSAASAGNDSLNDCLLPGPNLNPELVEVLLNFRLFDVALSADITRAYMCIAVADQDRPLFRFLWQGPDDEHIRCFQMKKVTWGATPSGFLLAAVLRQHFKIIDPDNTYRLGDHFYHDDLLRSFHTAEQAQKFISALSDRLMNAGMQLAKWKTNGSEVIAKLLTDGVAESTVNGDGSETLKVLGISWDPATDEFRPTATLAESCQLSKPTKRVVLRVVSSLYDPLGWLTPFILRGKLFIQRLWSERLQWDDRLDTNLADEFTAWAAEIDTLREISIPRQYGHKRTDTLEYHLHIFGDASQLAYACAAYVEIRYEDGSSTSTLVMSKSRVAPRKPVSLPRLELLAAVLAVRLRAFLSQAMHIHFASVSFYTDSLVTYYWCTTNDPRRFKTFVANRITEIQERSSTHEWFFVNGQHNISDLATRGVSASELRSNPEWWTGPNWIHAPPEQQPRRQPRSDTPAAQTALTAETRAIAAPVLETGHSIEPENFLQRCSSLGKARRVLYYVLRFRFLATKKPNPIPSEAELLRRAEMQIIKLTQRQHFAREIHAVINEDRVPADSKLAAFELFLDDEGILRARTRLTEGPFFSQDEKTPIVIPGESRLATLLILEAHRVNAHFGVQTILAQIRKRFWVTRGRQVIKALLRKCVVCRKQRAPAASQVEAPLPPERAVFTAPFAVTGTDFCGPFTLRTPTGSVKAHIMLFTCAATRAVHLELVPAMSTQQTLLAIRRFLAAYPSCRTFVSDNGRSLVRASTDIKRMFNSVKDKATLEYLANRKIDWIFICPRAPWNGGFYERMVGTVKNALVATLGKSFICFDQFRTVISELASIINERPITYASAEADSPTPLTPAHFLRGYYADPSPAAYLPLDRLGSTFDAATGNGLRRAHAKRIEYSRSLSRRWYREYLLQLRTANHRRGQASSPISVGDVCLVKDDNLPRTKWSLVRVEDTHLGRDGQVRSYSVRYSNGNVLRRPAQLLHPLEIV